MHDDDWFSLGELTGRLGALSWVENRLAELLTDWTAVESDDASVVYFATVAGHHRWHAQIVQDCLATSPRLREVDVVRAPTEGWQSTADTLRGLTNPDATAARLRALVKVVDPWIDRETAALLDLARPVSDAATSRWLRFVVSDHDHDAGAATELLAARSTDAVRFDEHLLVNELSLD